jgi:hypothetical protein
MLVGVSQISIRVIMIFSFASATPRRRMGRYALQAALHSRFNPQKAGEGNPMAFAGNI